MKLKPWEKRRYGKLGMVDEGQILSHIEAGIMKHNWVFFLQTSVRTEKCEICGKRREIRNGRILYR